MPPPFREFWGWFAFVVLSGSSTVLVVCTTPKGDDVWTWLASVIRGVEPLWIGSAILVYTVTEGYIMLADSFKRKLVAKYRQEGRQEGRQEVLTQLDNLPSNPTTEDIQRVIAETRRIMNGEHHQAAS